MNKMKRMITCFILFTFISAMLSGCSTHSSKSYTFSVDNGDFIKVALDTSDDYDITSDLPFVISCDGETLSQGIFIHAETYEQYAGAVESDEDVVILDSGTKDGNKYIFWSYHDAEFNYVIRIAGSDTGIILGNNVSEETARECFERITVSVAD